MNPILGEGGDLPIASGKVTSEGLRLREAIDGKIITELSKGDALLIFETRTRQYEWMRVKVVKTGQSGWVAARFVEVAHYPPKQSPRRWDQPPKPDHRGWTSESLFWLILTIIVGFILAVVMSAMRS